MMASALTKWGMSVAVVLAMQCSVVTAAQANQALDWVSLLNMLPMQCVTTMLLLYSTNYIGAQSHSHTPPPSPPGWHQLSTHIQLCLP